MSLSTKWRFDLRRYGWGVILFALCITLPISVLASKHSTPAPHKVSGKEYPVRTDGSTPTLTVETNESSYNHRLTIRWTGAAPSGMTGFARGGGVRYVIYRQRVDAKYPSDWQVLSDSYGQTETSTVWDDRAYDPAFPYRYAIRGHLFSDPDTFGQGSTLAALTKAAVQQTPAELTPFLETADEGKRCTASEVKSKPPSIPEKPTEQDVAKIRRGHQCHRKATQNLVEAHAKVIKARGGLEAKELRETVEAVKAAAAEWAVAENLVIERRKGITTDEKEKAKLEEQQKSAAAAAAINTAATTSDVGQPDPDEAKTPCDITEEKSLAEKLPGVGGIVTAGKTITQPSNAISNAIKQMQCAIANLYGQLFEWLLNTWVLNAAKVEDLESAQQFGGRVGGGSTSGASSATGTGTSGPAQGSGATGGSGPVIGPPPLEELLKQKDRERVEREQRNRSGAKPKSGRRPLLHFVLGIRPAQATLAQELRPGGTSAWVVGAWRGVLTAVNSFAAIVLLVIAIANIAHINIEIYGFRRALPAMIIGVVLANFSLTLIRFLLDVANAVTLVIVDAQQILCQGSPNLPTCAAITGAGGARGIAEVIGHGLSTALGQGVYSGTRVLDGSWAEFLAPLGDLAGFFVGIILLTIAAVALFLIGAVLWIRIVVLFVLIILAPLALFFYPLPFPMIQEKTKDWLKQLISWTFAFPVAMFFIWLATLAGQFNAGEGGATVIGYATLLVMLFIGFMAPFKMISVGGAAMESLLKKGPGWLAKQGVDKAWKGYGSLMARAGNVGKGSPAGSFKSRLGGAIRASNLYGIGTAAVGRYQYESEKEERRRRIGGLQGAIGRQVGSRALVSELQKEHRERYSNINTPSLLEDRFKAAVGGINVAQFEDLRKARGLDDFDKLGTATGKDLDSLIEGQAILNKMYATRAADSMVAEMETGIGGHGVVPYIGGGRGPAGARAPGGPAAVDQIRSLTNTAEIDPVEARAIVEAADQQGADEELDREVDRGLGTVDGRGGARVGTELQGIAPGARKRLASIMSGILDPTELKGVLAQDEEFKGLTPAQLTAVMATQEQISPGVQAKQNLEQLRLKNGLGNLSEQQEFGRQHAGFEAPVVRGNIGRLDQALNLVNAQRELTPDFQRQLQGTLAGIQVKTTDPRSGNVRITSLDRTLGSAVLGDRTQLIRTLTNQRAGAQAVAANPGQPVETIFRAQGAELTSRATANQTTGQVVKLVGETAPENIKTAITQPNHPIRKNLTGAVQTNVRALLEQQGVKVQANNPEFNRRVNQTVEQLVGTIGNNLTPGQRVNAKQIQEQVALSMRDAVNKNFGQFLQGRVARAAAPASPPPAAGGNKQRQEAATSGRQATPAVIIPPTAPAPRSVTTEAELTARGPAKGVLRSAKELARGRATTGGPTPTSTAEGPKSVPTTEDTVVGQGAPKG